MIFFSLETKIDFGTGVLGSFLRTNLEAMFIVYSPSAILSLETDLREKLDSKVLDGTALAVSSEPEIESIDRALAQIASSTVEVLGIGGGSAMDTAKSIAAALETNCKSLRPLLESTPQTFRSRVRLTLAPSTSGTGSELSKAAIVYDPVAQMKRGLRGPLVTADRAIIDPALTLSCSPATTAETGFDAFAHATETYLSVKSNELTQNLSVFAILKLVQNLPLAVREGSNAAARESVALASLIAGYNLAQASTCLPHRIQYAFSKDLSISHGLGLAMIYPHWLSIPGITSKKRKALERALGIASFPLFVESFCDEIGLTDHIADQFSRSRFQVDVAKVQGNLTDDPDYSPEFLQLVVDSLNKRWNMMPGSDKKD